MSEKIVNNKMITCAIVMIDREGNILGCHGTNKDKGIDYDFPKGCAEENENDIQAAIRELREETDIHLLDYDRANIIDCGIYPHNKKKDIHIFLYRTTYFPKLEQLKCTSYFEVDGKKYKEMDGYAIIPKNERNKFMKVLQNKFEIIDSFNK